MKFIILLSTITFLLSGCGFRTIPLANNYADKPYEFGISSIDDAWKKVVEYLVEKGIAIKVIDKSSGLLTTESTSFLNSFTWENKDGSLMNPGAYVVCNKVRGPLQMTSSLKPTVLNGQWVFLFKQEGEKSYLVIRLANTQGKVAEVQVGNDTESSGYSYNLEVKSTGQFEESIQGMLVRFN
jgi:hypothetical protein